MKPLLLVLNQGNDIEQLDSVVRSYRPIMSQWVASMVNSSEPYAILKSCKPRVSLKKNSSLERRMASLKAIGTNIRTHGFDCSLFGKKETGVAKNQMTSVFLLTTLRQKASVGGRLMAYKKLPVLKIFLFELDSWHISMSFHSGIHVEVEEKKSQIVRDFSKFGEFLKSRLGYGYKEDGKEENQELQFFLEFMEEVFGTKAMQCEWLEDVHQEPPPPPLPQPPLTKINVLRLLQSFHFFHLEDKVEVWGASIVIPRIRSILVRGWVLVSEWISWVRVVLEWENVIGILSP